MRLNPEFRRNLWLELSLGRFLGLAAVLALIVVGLEGGTDFAEATQAYAYIGQAGFFLPVA